MILLAILRNSKRNSEQNRRGCSDGSINGDFVCVAVAFERTLDNLFISFVVSRHGLCIHYRCVDVRLNRWASASRDLCKIEFLRADADVFLVLCGCRSSDTSSSSCDGMSLHELMW